MVSKASHAAAACAAGVPRVHIVNGREDEGLLAEVFSNEGIGTLIYANEYEQIRPAKKKDIRAIQQLTKKAVEAEELVRRTRAEMEKNLADYYIYEIDKNPVACVALHVYPGQQKGELASLYVDPSVREPGHRPKADAIRRKQSPRNGPDGIDHALDAGVYLLSSRRAALWRAPWMIFRRPAARNTTKADGTRRFW